MINAVIIDDERHSRNVLKKMLAQFCPTVQVIAEASGVEEGYLVIKSSNPQLLFLDVQMPEHSGFDLLNKFNKIDFEVIFVSAFSEHAVTAFEFNALGYVLKPIDHEKLARAVSKAEHKLQSANRSDDLPEFIRAIGLTPQHVQKVPFHHKGDVVFVPITDFLWIRSSEGVCEVKLTDLRRYYTSKDLKLFEELLKKSGDFIRVSKSCLVRISGIQSYQKGDPCFLRMADDTVFEVSRRKKTEVLNRLKNDE